MILYFWADKRYTMRAVIQRTGNASVSINGRVTASIGNGLLVLLGIEEADTKEDIEWLCGKIARLRVFPDAQGVMNRSVQETRGDVLVVSQFTLHASTKKGNRTSFIRAARPESSPYFNNPRRRTCCKASWNYHSGRPCNLIPLCLY